jgi:hypothetical protein
MKFLAAVLLLVSVNAFASYIPVYEAKIANDSTISLSVLNDGDVHVDCSYRMTWFENALTFKRTTGDISLASGEEKSINVKKDIAAKVTFLKAKVVCE